MDTENNNWPVWATEKVEIAEPDINWQIKGKKLIAELKKSLKEFNITNIEHIGSTAVPGLPAKPIIDIMAKVSSFDKTGQVEITLEPFGWNYVPHELDQNEWRRFFVKVENNKRTAHLHLVLNDSSRWDEHIKFRNILISNPALKNEYALLKKKLAEVYSGDREAYTKAKADFIVKVLN